MICGYRALINWDKVREDDVEALVELRVTPHGGDGYQRLADEIKGYPQVETLYLMSGSYDFLVMVKGRNLKRNFHVCQLKARINRRSTEYDHTFYADQI